MHIRGINYEKSAKGNDEQGQAIEISGDVLLFGFFFPLFPLLLKKGAIVSFCALRCARAHGSIKGGSTPSNTRMSIVSALASINNDQPENSWSLDIFPEKIFRDDKEFQRETGQLQS